jgi:hypothetical protein
MADIPIPIDSGTSPAVNTRVNNPYLFNFYVGESSINRLYSLSPVYSVSNILAIHYSEVNNGTYFIVTKNQFVTYQKNNTPKPVDDYKYSGFAVRISENANQELTIVDGVSAYVYQFSNNKITPLTTDQGFDIAGPVDTVVINTQTIIVGANSWALSTVNNALVYNGNDVRVIDASLGKIKGCGEYANTLFIFGERGIQRWVSSTAPTGFSFPFTMDDEFKKDFGVISTASIQANDNMLMFLCSDYHFRSMSGQGLSTQTTAGQAEYLKNQDGINAAIGSFVYYKGGYIYHLSYSGGNFVYAVASQKWSNTNKQIIGATKNIAQDGIVITSDSISQITNQHESELCEITSPVVEKPEDFPFIEFCLREIELKGTYGISHVDDTEIVELMLSRDNLYWSNSLKKNLPATGKRDYLIKWFPASSFVQLTARIRYYGTNDISFTSLIAKI